MTERTVITETTIRRGKLRLARTHSTRQGQGREERQGENIRWDISISHPHSYQYIILDEEELAALKVLLVQMEYE